MTCEAQNISHSIPPVFCSGIVDDNSTTKFRVKPELYLASTHQMCSVRHNKVSFRVLVGKSPLRGYLPPQTERRADSYASARRPFFDARGTRQNTFNNNSTISIAPAAKQNSICSSERGKTGSSSVALVGGVVCMEVYQPHRAVQFLGLSEAIAKNHLLPHPTVTIRIGSQRWHGDCSARIPACTFIMRPAFPKALATNTPLRKRRAADSRRATLSSQHCGLNRAGSGSAPTWMDRMRRGGLSYSARGELRKQLMRCGDEAQAGGLFYSVKRRDQDWMHHSPQRAIGADRTRHREPSRIDRVDIWKLQNRETNPQKFVEFCRRKRMVFGLPRSAQSNLISPFKGADLSRVAA